MTNDRKPPRAVEELRRGRPARREQLPSGDQGRGQRVLRRAPARRALPGADLDVTWVGLWGCEDPVLADSDGSRWLYCGVAEK